MLQRVISNMILINFNTKNNTNLMYTLNCHFNHNIDFESFRDKENTIIIYSEVFFCSNWFLKSLKLLHSIYCLLFLFFLNKFMFIECEKCPFARYLKRKIILKGNCLFFYPGRLVFSYFWLFFNFLVLWS